MMALSSVGGLSTCWSQSSALQLKVHIGGLEDDNAVQYLYYEDDTWWACPVVAQ